MLTEHKFINNCRVPFVAKFENESNNYDVGIKVLNARDVHST